MKQHKKRHLKSMNDKFIDKIDNSAKFDTSTPYKNKLNTKNHNHNFIITKNDEKITPKSTKKTRKKQKSLYKKAYIDDFKREEQKALSKDIESVEPPKLNQLKTIKSSNFKVNTSKFDVKSDIKPIKHKINQQKLYNSTNSRLKQEKFEPFSIGGVYETKFNQVKTIKSSNFKLKQAKFKPKVVDTPIKTKFNQAKAIKSSNFKLKQAKFEPKVVDTPIKTKFNQVKTIKSSNFKLKQVKFESKVVDTPIKIKFNQAEIIKSTNFKLKQVNFEPKTIDIPIKTKFNQAKITKSSNLKLKQQKFKPKIISKSTKFRKTENFKAKKQKSKLLYEKNAKDFQKSEFSKHINAKFTTLETNKLAKSKKNKLSQIHNNKIGKLIKYADNNSASFEDTASKTADIYVETGKYVMKKLPKQKKTKNNSKVNAKKSSKSKQNVKRTSKQQKMTIKKNYQNQKIRQQASIIKKTNQQILSSAKKNVVKAVSNTKMIAILGSLIMFIAISCMFFFVGGLILTGGVAGSSGSSAYLSTDENLIAVDNYYLSLENALITEIANLDNGDYDAVYVSGGSIVHDSHELASYLTALYGEYTLNNTMKSRLKTLFDNQFTYNTVHDSESNVLYVVVFKTTFNQLALRNLSDEQYALYQILLQNYGQNEYVFGGGSTDSSPSASLDGVVFTNGLREGNQNIVDIAMAQVGNVNGQPYWSWYGFQNRVAWCATFVSWVLNQAGFDEPKFASCQYQGVPYFVDNSRWASRGYRDLASGDVIFFDWDGNGTADHTGIVIGTDGTYVYTVEGNSGNECKIKQYSVNSTVIYGYGLMNALESE